MNLKTVNHQKGYTVIAKIYNLIRVVLKCFF